MMATTEKTVGSDTLQKIFQSQKQSSLTLRSEPISNRKKRLEKIRDWVKANRELIQQAVYQDFKKPSVEVDATEIFPVLDEIKAALSNLDQWVKSKKTDAPIT